MNKSKPKTHQIFSNQDLKVLSIEAKIGDILDTHSVDKYAILQVLSGSLKYVDSNQKIVLQSNEYHLIAPNIIHSLEFLEHSKLNLILRAKSILNFKKYED